MNAGRTIFAQLIEFLPHKEFQKCVARYRGDSNPRGFTCWDQYLAMIFAQLTYRESLRDIGLSRCAAQGCLCRCGNRKAAGLLDQHLRVARSNHRRDL
jgi:hypothetical protein